MAAEHGTWVFGPVIDMLETVGYVPGKSIRAFPYDWRCPPCKLQERDGYFTGAMEGIEELYAENQGCKVVIIGHSMGCKMTHYFCRWVATHPLGKARGGVQWLEKHIESMVALGGPFLGAPCSDRCPLACESSKMTRQQSLHSSLGPAPSGGPSDPKWRRSTSHAAVVALLDTLGHNAVPTRGCAFTVIVVPSACVKVSFEPPCAAVFTLLLAPVPA